MNPSVRPKRWPAIGWVGVVCSLAAESPAETLLKSEYIAIDLRGGPRSPILVDLDGDQIKDLVVANDRAISIRLGLGSGRFDAQWDMATRGRLSDLAALDLNADGALDLAAPDLDNGRVVVFLGHGDGTFESRAEFPVASQPRSMAVGDLNGDRWPDMVVGGSDVFILHGTSFGTLEPRNVLSDIFADDLQLADLNGDRVLDLVGLRWNSLVVLLGEGNGWFTSPLVSPAEQFSTELIAVDLDADSMLDVVVVNSDSRSVSVYRGRGDGSLNAPVSYSAGIIPTGVQAADFDHDGVLDLAVASSNTNELLILDGLDDARFAPPRTYPTGFQPNDGSVVGDLDEDGNVDVLVMAGQTAAIHFGNGDGTFGTALRQRVGRGPRGIVLDRIDQDEWPDAMIVHSLDGTSQPFFGNGDGSFRPGMATSAGVEPQAVATGELTYDAGKDLAVSGPYAVSVLQGFGDGSYGQRYDVLQGYGYGAPVVGRLAGGDRDDLILANYGFGIEIVSLTRFVRLPIADLSSNVVILDTNRDGALDLVTVAGTPKRLHAFPGDGSKASRTMLVSPQPVSGSMLVTADWTMDGNQDLALASESGVQFLGHRGDGTFSILHAIHVENPTSILAEDLDSDGLTDFACLEQANGAVAIWLAVGDGTLRPIEKHGVGAGANQLAAADVDRDGRMDLVATNPSRNEISVLLNHGVRTPVAILDFNATSDGRGVLLTWSLAVDDLPSCEVAVERAHSPDGPFRQLGLPMLASRYMSFLDASPDLESERWYRVQLIGLNGLLATAGPVEVRLADPPFLLAGREKPSGDVVIRCDLPFQRHGAKLELFDVAGRRLRAWGPPAFQSGRNDLVWDRRDGAGRRVRRGGYLLRLQADHAVRSSKLILKLP